MADNEHTDERNGVSRANEQVIRAIVRDELRGGEADDPDGGVTRREVLEAAGLVGVGALGGTTAINSAVGTAEAATGTGNLGTAENPLDTLYTNNLGSASEPVQNAEVQSLASQSVHTDKADIGRYDSQLKTTKSQFPPTNRRFANRGYSEDAGYRFEDLTNWEAKSGSTLTASTSTVYRGSQSAKATVSGTNSWVIDRDLTTTRDFTGESVSVALKRVKPTTETIAVRVMLYSDTTNNYHVLGKHNIADASKQASDWYRYDFGINKDDGSGSFDITSVSRIRLYFETIGGASVDYEVYIDDMRFVPRDTQGYVLFTFDDGISTDYTEAFPYLDNYGFSGVSNVSSDAIGGSGKLTLSQMQEMQAAGWEFANHTTNHATDGLLGVSLETAEDQIATTKRWLLDNGFVHGSRGIALPRHAMSRDVLDIAAQYHDIVFSGSATRMGALPSSLTTLSHVPRQNANYVAETQDAIDNVAQYGGILPLMFHEIGGSISVTDFQAIVDNVASKGSNIQVLTSSDLVKMQNNAPSF